MRWPDGGGLVRELAKNSRHQCIKDQWFFGDVESDSKHESEQSAREVESEQSKR